MASKAELLQGFVRDKCRRVFSARVAYQVRAGKLDEAKLIADESEYLAGLLAYEIGRTYSMLELEDIIKWRKRKVLDFMKERD